MSRVANPPLLSHSNGQPLLAYASVKRLTTFLVTKSSVTHDSLF